MEESSGEKRGQSQTRLVTNSGSKIRQSTWQRITLLIILGYEGAGALAGGGLLVAAPDGGIMDMPVDIMHGVFRNFPIPGLILFGLGILSATAFIGVLRRIRIDWLLSGLALGGLAIRFIVEIAILQEFHWLHAMWGLPVIVGCLPHYPWFYLVCLPCTTPKADKKKTNSVSYVTSNCYYHQSFYAIHYKLPPHLR